MGRIKESFRPLKKQMEDIDIESMFLSPEEKTQARNLLGKYLLDYQIENEADKNGLKQLIFLEILNFRLQAIINNLHNQDGTIPTNIVETIHKNINAIVLLKDKMGISKDKKAVQENDAYKALELLKAKFKKHREENQVSRHRSCPYCKQMIWFKMNMDAYEARKHPFFKDRIVGNEHLIRLYLDKTITREDVAKILQTSPDYTNWLVDKQWLKHPKIHELNNVPKAI